MNTVCKLVRLIVLSLIPVGCAGDPQPTSRDAKAVPHSRILQLYDRLEVGMTREQVEAVVGKPLFPPLRQPKVEDEYWYISKAERFLESHESPWGWGGIKVNYKHGRLLRKQYNSQWVARPGQDR